MSDIYRLITLGIGPASTIDGLILVGLNPAADIVFTGLRATTIKRGITGLDMDSRPGIYGSNSARLESGEGSWLFEDGSRMVWDTLTGDEGTIKRNGSGLVQ